MEVTSCSRIVLSTFLNNFVRFYKKKATEKGQFATYASLLQKRSILQQPGHFLGTGGIRLRSARKTELVPRFAKTPPHLQPANPMPPDYYPL